MNGENVSFCVESTNEDGTRKFIQFYQSGTKPRNKPFFCNYCDYKTGQISNLRSHITRHTGEKHLKCQLCGYLSSYHTDLRNHMKKHTGERHYCESCNYSTLYTSNFNRHILIHSNEKKYSCKTCDYKTNDLTSLKTHNRIRHSTEQPFSCEVCSYKTARLTNLRAHMFNRHKGEHMHPCQLCQYKGARLVDLVRHITWHNKQILENNCFNAMAKNEEHEIKSEDENPSVITESKIIEEDEESFEFAEVKNEPTECEMCGFEAFSTDLLQSHMTRYHKSTCHLCYLCTFSTDFVSGLKRHIRRTHPQVLFSCDLCTYKTIQSSQLASHAVEFHKISSSLVHCEQCDFTAGRMSVVESHIAAVHRLKEPTDATDRPPATETETEEDLYCCDVCDEKVTGREELVNHITAHILNKHHQTGLEDEEPFLCLDCGYCTNNLQEITHHSTAHNDETIFKCFSCTYRTPLKKHLKKHLKHHSFKEDARKKILMKCYLCGYVTYFVKNLKVHIKRHDPDEYQLCVECEYKTSTYSFLTSHMSSVHSKKPEIPLLSDNRIANTDPSLAISV